MEPALRTLGVLDRNSRISRFISEQQLHPCSHLHDLHCDCTQCEREQGASFPLSVHIDVTLT
jgi:hypothetical protein